MAPEPSKTTIDWLRFRTQAEPRDVVEGMRPLFGEKGSWLRLTPAERGLLGFATGSHLLLGNTEIGRLDYGGKSQRGWVRADVPGTGCGFVEDWRGIDAVEALPSVQLRRIDLALTTWKGEVGFDQVKRAHAAGGFTTSGRPPVLREITSSDPRAGRTLYVGARDAPKFLRAYEKGFELAAKLRLPGVCTHINGYRIEDIFRIEAELKDKGQGVPFAVVRKPDHYFAGCYPFCASLLPGVEADVMERLPYRAPMMEVAAAYANVRAQFGSTLYTLLAYEGGDESAVFRRVVGDKHNERMLRAGVLDYAEEAWAAERVGEVVQ